MKPFFSIIVPTLNRASTLTHCLETIEAQDFEDYEVIVSDNCSTDSTHDVVQRAYRTNNRIRYIRPESRLSMSRHWEFAFDHAEGRYVSFLGDDDGILCSGLKKAHMILRQHEMPSGLAGVNVEYHWPSSPIRFHESLIRTPVGDPYVQRRDCRSMLHLLKKHARLYIELPMTYRGFVRRDVLLEICNVAGRLIRSPIPDVYLAIAVAAISSEYLFTNEALFIEGVSGESNGAAMSVGPVGIDEAFFSDEEMPFHQDLPYCTTTAFMQAESLLQCRDAHLISDDMLMSPEDIISHAVQFASGMSPHRYAQSWEAISKLAAKHNLEPFAKALKEKHPNTHPSTDPFPSSSIWMDSRNYYEPALAIRGDAFGVGTVADCALLLKHWSTRKASESLAGELAAYCLKGDVRGQHDAGVVYSLTIALSNRMRTAFALLKKEEVVSLEHNQAMTAIRSQLAQANSKLAQANSKLIQTNSKLARAKAKLTRIRNERDELKMRGHRLKRLVRYIRAKCKALLGGSRIV